MKLLGKRMASVVLAGSLVLTGLAGCGGSQPAQEEQTEATSEQTAATTEQEAEQEDAGPKTANELILLYKQNGNTNNEHVDFNMDFTFSDDSTSTDEYGYEDTSANGISIKTVASLDCAGDNAHGTLTASALGEETTKELYYTKSGTKYVTYSSTDNGTTWTKDESDQNVIPSDDLTMDTLMSQGELAKTSTGYTLTVPGNLLMQSLSGDLGLGENATNSQQLMESFKNSSAVYVFNNDYQLVDVTFNAAFKPAATAEANKTEDGTEDATQNAMDSLSASLNLSMKFSNFGQIQSDAVTVPQTVTSSATEATGENASGEYGEYDEYGYDTTGDYSEYDTDYSGYDDTAAYDDTSAYDSTEVY